MYAYKTQKFKTIINSKYVNSSLLYKNHRKLENTIKNYFTYTSNKTLRSYKNLQNISQEKICSETDQVLKKNPKVIENNFLRLFKKKGRDLNLKKISFLFQYHKDISLYFSLKFFKFCS